MNIRKSTILISCALFFLMLQTSMLSIDLAKAQNVQDPNSTPTLIIEEQVEILQTQISSFTEESNEEKDGWDKFEIISGFLSGIVIIIISTIIAFIFRQREMKISRSETLLKFFPLLKSSDVAERESAAQLLAKAGDIDFALDIYEIYKRKSGFMAALHQLTLSENRSISKKAYKSIASITGNMAETLNFIIQENKNRNLSAPIINSDEDIILPNFLEIKLDKSNAYFSKIIAKNNAQCWLVYSYVSYKSVGNIEELILEQNSHHKNGEISAKLWIVFMEEPYLDDIEKLASKGILVSKFEDLENLGFSSTP